ncbi:MAG TPA: SemiSWEET transporter [Ignavibacteria bacterium]
MDLATIIGLFAAFLTTFAFLPQSIRTIRTKQTKDLSLPTIIMLEIGLISWLIYGLMTSSIPVIAANTVSILIMTLILILKIRYK